MSRVDEKLEAWRDETEAMQPSPELMAGLASLVAASTTGAAAGAGTGAAAAKTGVLTKLFLASIVGGAVAIGAFTLKDDPRFSPSQLKRLLPSVPIVTPLTGKPVVVVKTVKRALGPQPPRLAEAIKGLPATCAAQRDVLLEVVDREAVRDADAAVAALARHTLLCRKTKGTAGEPAYWPWALVPDAARGGCDLSADACPAGATVADAIAKSERCIAAAAAGSCERRAARLKAVFAWCEQTIHAGPAAVGDFKKLGMQLSELTSEFGSRAASAAWCQNLEAQAEQLRLRAP